MTVLVQEADISIGVSCWGRSSRGKYLKKKLGKARSFTEDEFDHEGREIAGRYERGDMCEIWRSLLQDLKCETKARK
jgi:hypothetical protein